jgi:D-glycero-alpha-D-manno-heptose-7-phosphate kinase
LGSSSSVTVGLLHALYTYKGDLVTSEKLAREACEIEIDILRRPLGIQDQYIAAYGGLRGFNFLESGKVEINRVDISPWEHLILSSRLLMFYLNRTRKSSSILEEQKQNIPNKIKTLCYMRDMSYDLYKQLKDHNLDIVGYTMNQGWLKKKSLASKVSDPKIDLLYEKALAAGALGGKVAGAGGGGFLLLYVPREKQNSVREQLGNLRELPFTLEPDGSKVIFNQRRPTWK